MSLLDADLLGRLEDWLLHAGDEVVAELGDFLGRHRPHMVGVVIDALGHFGVALRRRSQGH